MVRAGRNGADGAQIVRCGHSCLAGLVFEHRFEAGDLALQFALAGDHHQDVDHQDEPRYPETAVEESEITLQPFHFAGDVFG